MKKIMQVIIAAFMFITPLSINVKAEETLPFTDIAGHWAEPSIMEMHKRGVVDGYPDGTFRPEDRVTIEQFAKILLMSLMERNDQGELEWSEKYLERLNIVALHYLWESGFDPNNITQAAHWSDPYFDQLKAMALIYRESAAFEGKVDRPLTREVAAFMLRNLLHEVDFEENRNYASLAARSVKDYGDITPHHEYDVGLVILKGVMRGMPDRNFKPKGYITRAEAITIANRILNWEARDPFQPDVTGEYHMSYESERGTVNVVFNNKDFYEAWVALDEASGKSQGYAYMSGTGYYFYNNKSEVEEYFHQVESEVMGFVKSDPFKLRIGIDNVARYYFIAMNVKSEDTKLHQDVYEHFIEKVFGDKAEEFDARYMEFAEAFKENGSIKPIDHKIGSYRVRIMKENYGTNIVAFISLLH